ncbi:MAG: hypothetical protein WB511_12705 [Nitrososphaeraceae archaeon]
MVRQKAVDYDSKTKERKEFLTFTSEWYAYDYFGAEIKLGKTHIEDSYKQQTKKLVNKLDMTSGRMNSWYEMDSPRTALNIPFTRANVDKYLLSSTPLVQIQKT